MAGLVAALSLIATGALAADPASIATVTATDHVLGNPRAPITLIEYGSVACPACASFNEDVMPQIKAKYIDTGKVRYVFRPMLTGVPTIAVAGTRLAECAGKDKYFAVVDAVMRGQKDYYAMGENNMLARPVLIKIAQSFGLDEAAFNTCAGDADGLQGLQNQQDAAIKAGVRSTPTLFVNGKKLENNQLADVEKAIADAK
ncbi:MAG: thioredoxin domain-containing protein [Asticcacaulis sp.]